MFAGHLGAALAIGRFEQRINVGVFVAAALLLDIALWTFVLLGWESVLVPANYSVTHQLEFVFPASHGLAASAAWSALCGLAVFAAYSSLGSSRLRAAALSSVAVFSHWLLDVLVHKPELPVAGTESTALGFDLWRNMPLALAVEGLVLVGGLASFLPVAPLSSRRKAGIAALCILVLLLSITGMTVAPPPPSGGALAAGSLASIAVVCTVIYWLARASQKARA